MVDINKILSFDIEILDELPEEDRDLSKIRPSVAAICTTEDDVEYFYDDPYMTKETACRLVNHMTDKVKEGYTIFAWNSTAFDFVILAHHSGMYTECAELALNSVDGMLLVTFRKGYFLSLDATLRGAGLDSKTHSITFSNGVTVDNFSGRDAPEAWRNREFEAVKTYLRGDVIQPLKLAREIEKNKGIRWVSKTGKNMFVFSPMTKVRDLFFLPIVKCEWMSVPPAPRSHFVGWMPKNIREKYLIRD